MNGTESVKIILMPCITRDNSSRKLIGSQLQAFKLVRTLPQTQADTLGITWAKKRGSMSEPPDKRLSSKLKYLLFILVMPALPDKLAPLAVLLP